MLRTAFLIPLLLASSSVWAQERRSVARPHDDLLATVRASGSFASFSALLEAAGADPLLGGEGPYTLLVPTEAAFARLGEGGVQALIEKSSAERLRAIVRNHIVAGRLSAADLAERAVVRTLAGHRLPVAHSKGVLSVAGADVKAANIPATNGLLHSMAGVLAPTTRTLADMARPHGRFMELVREAGLESLLGQPGPYTLFVPSEEALSGVGSGSGKAKLHVAKGRIYSEDALRSGHVEMMDGTTMEFRLADGKEVLGNARIVEADIEAANGVLHLIDRVLSTDG